MNDPQPSERPAATRERQEAIAPYLVLIGAEKPQDSEQEFPARITVENRVIELDDWEWSTLAEGLGRKDLAESDEGRIADWPQRLAEGVAFQARYLTHISRLQDGPAPAPSELNSFRRELITDVALGLALQEELQQDIHNLVAVGALDDAKKLTGFRHKIGQGIGRLKDVVGEAGFEQAEAKGAAMVRAIPRQARTHHALDHLEEPDERPTQARWERSYGRVSGFVLTPRRRIKPLLLLLAASLLLWGTVQHVLRQEAGPPPVPAADFSHIAGVHRVDVRPPSLFVTVEALAWRERSEPERLALVDDVAQIAAKNGYQGVHFRTTAGLAVAQWMAKSGPRLLERRNGENGKT